MIGPDIAQNMCGHQRIASRGRHGLQFVSTQVGHSERSLI